MSDINERKAMVLFVGNSGAGKTTLAQAIYGEELKYQKTQTVVIRDSIIDTPGEYTERRQLNRQLMVTSYDADLVVLVEAADNELMFFSPGFTAMFNAPCIGVITKIDLHGDTKAARFRLEYAGVKEIFEISSVSGKGVEALKNYLSDKNIVI